jgi:tetratricopeptide (TPR) repeat protein
VALATRVPENRDVLHMIAVCERCLGRVPEALATLEKLEKLHPRFARLFEERGNCHVFLRDAPRAIEAFSRAVSINPALPSSWRSLHGLFRLTGRAQDEAVAASHVKALGQVPPDILTATCLFYDGDLIPAETLVRAHLQRHGDHIEGMRLLARIALELDILDMFQEAEVLLEAVLTRVPDYTAARFDYARVLLCRHKHAEALAELETLLRAEPANRTYRTTVASTYVGMGQHARALDIYRELLADTPDAADLRLSVGHALRALGRQSEAIEAYRDAAAARPAFGDAYWSLANLKTYRFAPEDLATLRAAESDPRTNPHDRMHLCFALGKALEDGGDYAQSFGYYERGNALKRAQSRYRPDVVERNAKLQRDFFTRELFARLQGVGLPAPDPIFIVGLPRSGSTLLEQILATHSLVEGTMELATLPRIVLELRGRIADAADVADPIYPRMLAQMRPEWFAEIGKKYLDGTRVYRRGKPFFVDKMPNNFRHVGLIHLILPNARIIDARRASVPCCLSNFKQLFASGQEFTYDLENLGRYYRSYVELMAHWDEVLPGKVLRINYEEVVADLEAQVRRLLAFCGLPFEARCVDFHATARNIGTASSEQVRRPIFRESLAQWRHYEPWLGPLKAALGDLA